MNIRDELVSSFEDTLLMIEESPSLKADIEYSREHSTFFPADSYPALPKAKGKGVIEVNRSKTFEAAKSIWERDAKGRIAVLNFASATNPGGGVLWGSSAQEECLCRASTLYPVISSEKFKKPYYLKNADEPGTLYNDGLIYSEGITVFKDDERIPNRLPKEEWFKLDVITCAAPNLRSGPIEGETLYKLHLSRARHILHVAASKEVDYLVLGAFGCGAFRNDPNIVSLAYRAALEEYAKYFNMVEFAIYCRPYEEENLLAFLKNLKRK